MPLSCARRMRMRRSTASIPPWRKRAPGVLAVYTGADVEAAGLGSIKCVAPLKNRDGTNFFNPGRPLLATNKVRHVGDPVALVIADSLAAAKDALDLIEVDYAELPAVVDPAEAVKPGAPALWDEQPSNVALDWGSGRSQQMRRGVRQGGEDRDARSRDQPRHGRAARAARHPRRIRSARPSATRCISARKALSACAARWRSIWASRTTRCASSPAMSAAASA